LPSSAEATPRRSSSPRDGGYAARIDIAAPPDSPSLADVKALAIDYDAVREAGAQVKRKFNEIFQ